MRQPRSDEWKGAEGHDTRPTPRSVHIEGVSALPKPSRLAPEGRDRHVPKTRPRVAAEGRAACSKGPG
eukprot:5988619-Pyramimonas_sp.AAC.1